MQRLFLCAAALAALGIGCSGAQAAPDEIQVYTEEMDDPGKFGLEMHVNYVLKGATASTYPGEKPSQHVLQTTPEFSYGITPNLEAGLYLPFAFTPDGNSYLNGLRGRLKYIAPRETDSPYFWGMNVELGHSSVRVSESQATLELRPILGYRNSDWLLAFNPILSTNLSRNVNGRPEFEPALKATHRVGGEVHAGMEYYGSYGPLSRFVPSSERSHYLYGVADFEVKGLDINVGIGRGFENAGDKWVAKAIIALPFD
ncbi:MAG: hypothetical protein KGN39_10720 [Betaproteobacteria bacterium]|nr:hypothetical protein [Betaproteobacteria bacterium]